MLDKISDSWLLSCRTIFNFLRVGSFLRLRYPSKQERRLNSLNILGKCYYFFFFLLGSFLFDGGFRQDVCHHQVMKYYFSDLSFNNTHLEIFWFKQSLFGIIDYNVWDFDGTF